MNDDVTVIEKSDIDYVMNCYKCNKNCFNGDLGGWYIHPRRYCNSCMTSELREEYYQQLNNIEKKLD